MLKYDDDTKLGKMIAELCPDGVEYLPLGQVCDTLKKGTLKTDQLQENGLYPVINSGRDFYGRYESFNNEGNAITIAARGEYAGFITYISERFWAGGLCYPYRSKNENKLSTRFLYHYLKGNESHIMNSMVARGSIPALNKADVDVARQFFCETRTEFLRKNSPVLRSKSETRSLASTAPKMEGAAHVKGRVLAWGGAAFAAPPLAFCPWGSSYPSVASPASSAASCAATGSVYSDQP